MKNSGFAPVDLPDWLGIERGPSVVGRQCVILDGKHNQNVRGNKTPSAKDDEKVTYSFVLKG
jgi:hypothetical protein